MNKRLFVSVAAAALIAGTGFASAQNPGGGAGAGGTGAGMSREAPAGGAAGGAMRGGADHGAAADHGAMDHTSPAAGNAGSKRDEATDTTNKSDQKPAMKQSQSDDKMQRDNGKNAKDMKADSKSPNDKSTTTTGQAAAGGKLTTEQRTKVTTVIKEQHIKPVTNVNFSINVGTRVPRTVEFHPVPQEIVTIYPSWRGYNFILVNEQIVIIDPSTYEIVAVIDA